jgi:hypothetical protein
MPESKTLNRRLMVKSSLFGLLAVQVPYLAYAKSIQPVDSSFLKKDLYHRYPAIDEDIVAEVVGASHFDFKRIRDLVGNRPELSRATLGLGLWGLGISHRSSLARRPKRYCHLFDCQRSPSYPFHFRHVGRLSSCKRSHKVLSGHSKKRRAAWI